MAKIWLVQVSVFMRMIVVFKDCLIFGKILGNEIFQDIRIQLLMDKMYVIMKTIFERLSKKITLHRHDLMLLV